MELLHFNVYNLTNFNRSERAALLQLQDLIPKLSQRDKIAFSLLLVYSYSMSAGRELSVAPISVVSQDLTAAILQMEVLPIRIKLKLAIELLTQYIDEDDDKESSEI